jgi:monooxygenase
MEVQHVDVLIIGAGLSGIGAAWHLQHEHPTKTYAILEGRDTLGGTWDLFRYPGIRSDSDMYTLGYVFRPWTDPKAIADGASILAYIRDTAEQAGIDRHIQYNHRVERASWSSKTARWTVDAGGTQFTCSFLYCCAGYYDYDAGYTPDFPGRARFGGRIIHPQQWTDDVDYTDKRVIVIGSGATAVTLVPALAERAAHVTMLQRSPSYIASKPARDPIADWLRARMPAERAYAVTRWKNVLFGMGFYAFCRRYPERAKKFLVKLVEKQVGRDAVNEHFTPSYNPWDQRLCLVPDADLFDAIKAGRAEVVTDHIETFTERGIQLRGGRELEADLIVTATGLKLKLLGGVALDVDGRRWEPTQALVYKGMMFSDVPNLAFASGYTNASWTLKVDLTSRYVCRLLRYMDAKGYRIVTPRRNDPEIGELPLLDFTSGYVQRSIAQFPKQGSRKPWRLFQNYALDRLTLERSRVDDDAVEFSR